MTEQRPDEASFHELLAALRSGPRPDEVAGEVAHVEAMLSALAPMEASPVIKLTSRTPRIVGLVAASVLAAGGLAAAGAGTFLPSSSKAPIEQAPPVSRPLLETPRALGHAATTTSSTTSTTLPAEVVAVTDAEQVLVDDPTTAFDETQCAEGSHGRTVSSVAHSVEPGPEHGPAVAEAAQSSCGKDAKAPDSRDPADETLEKDDEQDDTKPSDGDGRGNADGRAHADEHGKGNAKDRAGDD